MGGNELDIGGVHNWAINAVEELALLKAPNRKKLETRHDKQKEKQKWQPTGARIIKINCDESSGSAAVGVITRDEYGRLVVREGKGIYTKKAKVAKAVAINMGVRLAKKQGMMHRVEIETDSKNLVLALNGAIQCVSWQVEPMVAEINSEKFFQDIKFLYVGVMVCTNPSSSRRF